MLVIPVGMMMPVIGQLLKVYAAISVMPCGSAMLVIWHPAKALTPISVTLSGRSMLVSPHPSNALAPMRVRVSGRCTLSRNLHLEKVPSEISVIPSGIEMLLRFVAEESAVSDFCERVGKRYGFQLFAIEESSIPDLRNAFGNDDLFDTVGFLKCIFSYGGYPIAIRTFRWDDNNRIWTASFAGNIAGTVAVGGENKI